MDSRTYYCILIVVIVLNIVVVLSSKKHSHSEYINLPYEIGKTKVKILDKIPPKTNDHIGEIVSFKVKLNHLLGVTKFFNGKENTNNDPVSFPVQSWFPKFESIKYYFLYVGAINCESSLDNWTCYYCKTLGRNIQVIDIHYGFYYNTKVMITANHKRKEIVITFRTTHNVLNLLVDALLVPGIIDLEDMEILVHKGFRDATRVHYSKIVKILKKLLPYHPTYKIILTGWSLGASMASITLFMFKYLNVFPKSKFELYCYGLPRTGNKAFADFMNNLTMPIVRVNQGFDSLVNGYPAALGYFHFHNEIYLTDIGEGRFSIQYCRTDIYEDPECSPNTLGLTLPKAIMDHLLILGYEPNICPFENPVEFVLQSIWPLRQFIPPRVVEAFPKFSIHANLFGDIREFLYRDIKNIYSAAIKPETYYDPRYTRENVIGVKFK